MYQEGSVRAGDKKAQLFKSREGNEVVKASADRREEGSPQHAFLFVTCAPGRVFKAWFRVKNLGRRVKWSRLVRTVGNACRPHGLLQPGEQL
ncbi:hypothetical protein HYQ46_009023 [Verticillium longisporum]|nr:hypothetical protein HYQ46_009023 [Verticillium longisporum]